MGPEGKIDVNIMLSSKPWDTAAGVVAREAGATVVDIDDSPHSMTAHATITASPKLVADLVEPIAQTRKVTRHTS